MSAAPASPPTRPYGVIADPAEYVTGPEPGWNRPDAPVNPPDPGTSVYAWHPGNGWRTEDLTWLSGRKAAMEMRKTDLDTLAARGFKLHWSAKPSNDDLHRVAELLRSIADEREDR